MATTLHGISGPGATCAPNACATSARSEAPLPLTLPPPSSSGTSIDIQPELGTLAPEVGLEAGLVRPQLTDLGDGALAAEELPRGVAEELLVVGQHELHGVLFWSGAAIGGRPAILASSWSPRNFSGRRAPDTNRGSGGGVRFPSVGVVSRDQDQTVAQLQRWLGRGRGPRGCHRRPPRDPRQHGVLERDHPLRRHVGRRRRTDRPPPRRPHRTAGAHRLPRGELRDPVPGDAGAGRAHRRPGAGDALVRARSVVVRQPVLDHARESTASLRPTLPTTPSTAGCATRTPTAQSTVWWNGIAALAAVHNLDWRALGLERLDDRAAR